MNWEYLFYMLVAVTAFTLLLYIGCAIYRFVFIIGTVLLYRDFKKSQDLLDQVFNSTSIRLEILSTIAEFAWAYTIVMSILCISYLIWL